MTKCSKCNLETYSMNIDGLCLECWVRLHPDVSLSPITRGIVERMNMDYLKEASEAYTAIIGGERGNKKTLKVQFFEESNLMIMRDQMNKFFEQEGLSSKDRIASIKYLKDDYGRYSVMIVYEVDI